MNKTVLVVEDAVFSKKLLIGVLEEAGFKVIGEAEDGKKAVELYKKFQPDIVTMDINMPIMDGIESLKKIIEFNAKANVIIVSALGQSSKITEAIKNGATNFIIKPYDPQHVIEVLNDVIIEK
ncbi:MAG: response regulator [bacterium]